jgi:cyclopropane-fatty-acyl-phospholipid synthase
MVAESLTSPDPRARIAEAILRLVFGDAYARGFAIRLWDGSEIPSEGCAEFTLCVNSPGALRTAFRHPIDLNVGRAFAAGVIDCEGEAEAVVDALMRATSNLPRASMLRAFRLLLRLPKESLPVMREAKLRGRVHSLDRDRAAVGFHYDQPVSFYAAILDQDLVYSCAYFDDGIETLDDAQTAKLDYVLRKLRLRPGERFLDIGCGWGSLVIEAARRGAHALGVTLSREQHAEAQRRIAALGIENRARVDLRDYRELAAAGFDKIASIGMYEHVGRAKLPEYFGTVYKLLRPAGLFLNHGIADQSPGRTGGRITGFMQRFVFPDGELVAVSDALQIAERCGFEVRDVENLREHYTRTLRCWVKNIERNRDDAIAAAGEQAYRIWRLYMAGSAQGFRVGRLGVFQSLLAKPTVNGFAALPATRRDLYARETLEGSG